MGNSFYDIALKYNGTWASRWRDGDFRACANGQGVVADWMCSSITDTATELWAQEYAWFPSTGLQSGALGFTLSYYISTAPAVGMMAAVSSFPIWAMWRFGPLSRDRKPTRPLFRFSAETVYTFHWWSLLIFQIGYCVFLSASSWGFGILHIVSVGVFIAVAGLHFVVIAVTSMQQEKILFTRKAKIVFGLMGLALLALILGSVSYLFPFLDGYGFAFGEAAGLSCIFAVTPALVFFGENHTSNDLEIVWTAAGMEWVQNSILGAYILSQAGGSEQGHRVSTAQLLRIADIQLNMTTFDSVIKELMRRGYAVHVESTTTESKDSHEDPASLPDGP